MKTRRTKFLLSFFAIAILGFALVNAFTIEVQNRDPFGTLNLSTLMIKPNANSSGTMLLSGYTLKINPFHKNNTGQIRVYQICDESGSNCKNVSELSTGGGGDVGGSFRSEGASRLFPTNNDGKSVWINKGLAIGRSGNMLYDSGYKLRVNGPTKLSGDLRINSDAVDLSGDTLRIKTDQGKIKVNEICDKDENNCKPVSALLTGIEASGGNGGGGNFFGVQWSPMRVTRTGGEPSDVSGYFAITPIKSGLNGLNVWVGDRPYTDINRRAKDYKLRVWSGITRINGDLAVTPFGLSSSENTTEFYVNENGISMFGSPYFYRTNGSNDIRGLSVNGPIFAGHSGNYIYMYANGTSADDENRSYEILGENELAVGTRGGSFIYFTQRTGTYNNITGGSYPGVTLDLSGITQAYSCPGGGGTSKGNQGGGGLQQIVYGEQNLSGQCSGVNVQVHTGHSWHGVNPDDVFDNPNIDNIYSSLMVGVNTDDPQATLDVNGSLRIGSNCLPIGLTCDASNVGTMMYLERKATYQGSLVICVADGITGNKNDGYTVDYKWYDIMRGLAGTNLSELGFNVNNNDEFSCILPKPNAGVYPMPADPIEFESEPKYPISED